MHGAGVEGDRRFHRDEAQQLEQVVLHHVAQRARLLVVRAARLHADRLGDGDLDLGHVVTVPQRLEDPVGETEHEKVLDGLLAEVVIDAIDLVLAKDQTQMAVERPSALVVVPEGLLDDDARPAPLRA